MAPRSHIFVQVEDMASSAVLRETLDLAPNDKKGQSFHLPSCVILILSADSIQISYSPSYNLYHGPFSPRSMKSSPKYSEGISSGIFRASWRY